MLPVPTPVPGAVGGAVALSEYVRGRVLPDLRTESLEARVSRLEMVIAPGELLSVAKGVGL